MSRVHHPLFQHRARRPPWGAAQRRRVLRLCIRWRLGLQRPAHRGDGGMSTRTGWTEATPRLEAEVRGVRLAPDAVRPDRLHGAFRVARADIEGLPAQPLAALVLVAQDGPATAAARPFRDVVLFADDGYEAGGL